MNPLHDAARNGDINKVRGLLETGAYDINKKVNDQNGYGRTPLHNAAGGGHRDVAALLIQHGADPCSTDQQRRTPLHMAAEGGHNDVAALLIQHEADPCSTGGGCITPLHEAARGGHSDVAALLIQHGADPRSTDSCGGMPLHHAAEGGHRDVVALLIEHEADPCSIDREGSTPLHKAAWGGHRDLASLLIQHGADPCSTDRRKRTPLHHAAQGGQSGVAKLLIIQHGADLCSRDEEGLTPLHDAAWGGHSEVVDLLIQHGADPCSTGRWGRTPLHEAAGSGKKKVADVLIQKGADPRSTDENGRTPLHIAAQGGHSGVAFLLIQHGADLCSKGKCGRTPLHLAVVGGHSDVAALLLQHGADPCCTDSGGERPSVTIQWRNQGLATLLKKFENDQVKNFIFVLSLEHVAARMNNAEADTLFKEDMRCHSQNERRNKLEMLRNWAQSYGLTTIQELKARLAGAGCQNLTGTASEHYDEIVKQIMDMTPSCYERFCQDPWSHRHLITSAVAPTEQRCEISMETESYEYDAFLVHSSDDGKTVGGVCKQLEARGVRCCYAPRDFAYGKPIPASTEEAFEKSKFILVIFSENSMKSPWCQYEMHMAVQKTVESRQDVVIPILLDFPEENLPLGFKTMKYISVREHDFLSKLVQTIEGPGVACTARSVNHPFSSFAQSAGKSERLPACIVRLYRGITTFLALNKHALLRTYCKFKHNL